jgi:hypothetical protein
VLTTLIWNPYVSEILQTKSVKLHAVFCCKGTATGNVRNWESIISNIKVCRYFIMLLLYWYIRNCFDKLTSTSFSPFICRCVGVAVISNF